MMVKSTLVLLCLFFSQIGLAEYSFMDDGGEHPICECQESKKVPKPLKKTQELKHAAGYLGSQQTEFAEKNEAGIDSFEHYFTDLSSCQKSLEKQIAQYEYQDVCLKLPENKNSLCAKEGQSAGGSTLNSLKCCEGLILTNSWQHQHLKDGCKTPPPGSGGTCVKCGDGTCDSRNSENKCNCPKDCK